MSNNNTCAIPDYDDLMTIEDFISYCKSGSFIDYDGYGHLADQNQMYWQTYIFPSEILKLVKSNKLKRLNEKYTHIVWFNR